MTTVAPAAPVEEQPKPGEIYWRQLDLVNPEKLNEYSFVVVGAGTTGSWTALALAKMGARSITVWDRDVVNEHNAPVQVYSQREAGRRKVEVLVDRIGLLTGQAVFGQCRHLDKDAVPVFDRNTVLIMAVDDMNARKYLWELAKSCPEIRLVIDPRLASEVLRLYAIDPQDPQQQEFYEGNFYTNEEAAQVPCTAQAIVYTGMFTASFVTAIIASFINGVPFVNELSFHCRQFKIIGSQV